MSANLKASVDGTQAIIGVGNVDQMTVSNAGVVTANSFVGLNGSSVTATGSTTARTLANRFADIFNVKDFGAVGDGVTDCQTAFQTAINSALAAGGGTIYIPKGIYNFPNTSNAGKLDPGLGNLTFKGDGDNVSILRFFEGTGNPQQGNLFQNVTNNPNKGSLNFYDLQFRGTLDTRSVSHGAVFWCDYYSSVTIQNCKIYNIAGFAMDFHYLGSFQCVNSKLENIARDGIRVRDTSNCLVTGNYIKRTGDDAIAIHSTREETGYIQRERIIVSKNTIVNCQGPKFVGWKKITFEGNVLFLTTGVHFMAEIVEGEGWQTTHDIIVSNNSITDTLTRSLTNPIPDRAIKIHCYPARGGTSTNGVIPGDYDSVTNKIVLPWDYTHDSGNYSTDSIPRAFNITVTGNTISKTVGAVAKFSDYLQGTMILMGLSADPPVTSQRLTSQNDGGIEFFSSCENVIVSNNNIRNVAYGISFFPQIGMINPPENFRKAIKNVIVSSNSIFDCTEVGISFSMSNPANGDIIVENNMINCDPYRLNQYSNIDGSYQNNSSGPLAIQGFQANGAIIRNNKIINCRNSIAASNSNIENNIIYCDTPVSEGWNAGNKGVGVIFASQGFSYVIQNSDPTSATYLEYISRTIETSNGIQPSSGWYPRGWFVRNMQQTLDANQMTISGWTRLTTGTGHVAGVDWAVARVSNVSPAT